MDRIDALHLFATVAELESFTKAAERMNLTPGAASKQVSALEERLQVRLLERTTRSVRLTDGGKALLERVRPWLQEYESIEQGMSCETHAPAGRLRISAPTDFGVQKLIDPVTAFMKQWPQVEVLLDLSDRMVDLVDEGYDLAVRIGHLSDSSLIAKRLSHSRMAVFASTHYLEAAGTPTHPKDLGHHHCIIDRNKPTPYQWVFQKGGDTQVIKVDGPLSLNGARAAVKAACAGMGIACSPDWAAREALEQEGVVRILQEWEPDHRDLWAVFPSNRYLTHRVRLFVDFLGDWFKDGF
ncbi:LysR family transcriptional regulator [Woodsholea maritima]|uniref:LysR family transcriptional regulator n=1 Tax=Woodsholea maritima TaxID=240237 RepID=UPI00059412CC|nr:LysR family transcriptional regulator [Woodsholea maritima]